MIAFILEIVIASVVASWIYSDYGLIWSVIAWFVIMGFARRGILRGTHNAHSFGGTEDAQNEFEQTQIKISTVTYIIIATFFIILTLFGLFRLGFISSNSQSSRSSASYSRDNLSSSEKARFKEIIASILKDPKYLTLKIRVEFWSLIDKSSSRPLTADEIRDFREKIVGMATTYQKYFWEDVLESLKTGLPVKSTRRQTYEKYILDLVKTDNTTNQIKKNEDYIANIVAGKPINSEGKNIIVTETSIKHLLANIDVLSTRMEKLFTRP